MSTVWEDAQGIIDRLKTGRVADVSSGYATLVSAAISGVTRYIVSIHAGLTSAGISSVMAYLANVDASGTETIIEQGELGKSAGSNDVWLGGGGSGSLDPTKPIWELDGDAKLQIRGSISGYLNVTCQYFDEV